LLNMTGQHPNFVADGKDQGKLEKACIEKGMKLLVRTVRGTL